MDAEMAEGRRVEAAARGTDSSKLGCGQLWMGGDVVNATSKQSSARCGIEASDHAKHIMPDSSERSTHTAVVSALGRMSGRDTPGSFATKVLRICEIDLCMAESDAPELHRVVRYRK